MPANRIIVGERYELRDLAGQGGMATVWRGVMHGAAGFTRQVAVKKIKPEFHAIQNYVDMFIEEARVGSDLAHPNIVQIHDFIIDSEGSYYLIMEWVQGVDLGSFVRGFREAELPVPWELMAAIAVGSLRGLGAAHERRRADGSVAPVIHRDVSPQNILLGVNGIVKITDFGLARARDRAYSLTAPGTVKGKLSYLAPEVSYGKPATPLSDLFSLGNVIWESLSGVKLFQGQTDLDTFKKIRKCEVPPLSRWRPDVPESLVKVINQALARDPGDRFPSARVMARAVNSVLKHVDWREDAQTQLGEIVSRIRTGRTVRPGPISGPVEVDPPNSDEISAAFDAVLLAKGPALLDNAEAQVEFTEASGNNKGSGASSGTSEQPAPPETPSSSEKRPPSSESIDIDFGSTIIPRKPSGKGKKGQ